MVTSLIDRLPSGSSVLVDSAPIIYVLDGSPHAKRFEPLFAAADEGRYELVVTPVTLAEVVAGPLRQKNEALANRYVGALTHPPFRLREMDEQIAVTAARLRIQYRLKLPDAIQVATALHEACQAIVTHDRDFSAITDILVLTG